MSCVCTHSADSTSFRGQLTLWQYQTANVREWKNIVGDDSLIRLTQRCEWTSTWKLWSYFPRIYRHTVWVCDMNKILPSFVPSFLLSSVPHLLPPSPSLPLSAYFLLFFRINAIHKKNLLDKCTFSCIVCAFHSMIHYFIEFLKMPSSLY